MAFIPGRVSQYTMVGYTTVRLLTSSMQYLKATWGGTYALLRLVKRSPNSPRHHAPRPSHILRTIRPIALKCNTLLLICMSDLCYFFKKLISGGNAATRFDFFLVLRSTSKLFCSEAEAKTWLDTRCGAPFICCVLNIIIFVVRFHRICQWRYRYIQRTH